MHKFSTTATKSFALPVLRSVGLLNVPYSTFAGASIARLVRSSLSSLRDKNLCIIRANCSGEPLVTSHRLAPTPLRDKNLCIIRASLTEPESVLYSAHLAFP